MTRDVSRLPQLDRLFLTDAGLESDMIYNHDLDLPCFAAITLLRSADGRRALQGYFRSFLELAQDVGTGLVLESATWRASPDWAAPLDLSQEELDDLNRQAIKMLLALRGEFESPAWPIVVSGCMGTRGDGYDPGKTMSYGEAADYHARQTAVLAEAGADMLAAITMTNVNEAVGIVRNAQRLEVPVAISFTVETDGTLPTNFSVR